MKTKPLLSHADVLEDLINSSEIVRKYVQAKGPKAYKYVSSQTGDFTIGATFLLKKYKWDYNSHGFACEGTKDWLSLFRMSGGSNHLEEFEKPGATKSYDYDLIPADKILDLPLDHQTAINIIEDNYIGKTLRAIACTADGCTKYGGRYYLFAIED